MDQPSIHYGACNLCEAICGLEYTVEAQRITAIRGDKSDPFSQGHICPKAVALKDIHEDPDRLRTPIRRNGDKWEPISWQAAFELVADRLYQIRGQHGANAVAVYQGNPSVHNYGNLTHAQNFLGLLKTRNRFSATSVDQLPHHLAAFWMFGHQLLLPIPDIDRTQYFLVMGANPMASNGSLMTVPNFRGRLKALKQRGGRMVVIDPRRTETAEVADEHHFIQPGSDVVLLLGMIRSMFDAGLIRLGALETIASGVDAIRKIVQPFTAESAAKVTGVAADDIRRMTREFCTAQSAVAYGRMGLSTQRFGSLCQWAINLLNILSGNLDRPGGAMFTLPAVDLLKGLASPGHFNLWQSRVRGLPEFGGELPVSALAEEILTPGDAQVRGLVTVAGNPVLSTPNGRQLDRALGDLEFMVSIDFYLNETTRHANIILPPTCGVEHDHYDLIFHHLAVRNTTRWSPALMPKPDSARHDWEIYNGLASAYRQLSDPEQALAKRVKALPKLARQKLRPDQILNLGLRLGPYGSLKSGPQKLSLAKLKKHPHGIDLGPLQSCLPQRLFTQDKKIRCDVPEMLADVARAQALLAAEKPSHLKLIGRRHIRSNNSWMHNFERLVKGKQRCQLLIHPEDATQRNLQDGDTACIESPTGKLSVSVSHSEEMMRGVVCLPHGWGHGQPGTQMQIANDHAGVSLNDLTDDKFLDEVSGNAALNGIEVEVRAVA